MDRGTWWATVHGVIRVDLATKQQQLSHSLRISELCPRGQKNLAIHAKSTKDSVV